MIPALNDQGCLPPGVHGATLQEASDYYVQTVFGMDRRGVPKGMIEVFP